MPVERWIPAIGSHDVITESVDATEKQETFIDEFLIEIPPASFGPDGVRATVVSAGDEEDDKGEQDDQEAEAAAQGADESVCHHAIMSGADNMGNKKIGEIAGTVLDLDAIEHESLHVHLGQGEKMTEKLQEITRMIDTITDDYESDCESNTTHGSMGEIVDSSDDEDMMSVASEDYDIFEEYPVFEIPLRTARGTPPKNDIMINANVKSQETLAPLLSTPDGSHEGRVPVTDDGNPGNEKINMQQGTPMPKPSTRASSIVNDDDMIIYCLWMLIANLLSLT